MKIYSNYGIIRSLNEAVRSAMLMPNIASVLLSKVECYNLWKWVKENTEDGICEDLTWNTGMVYNCNHFGYDHMYKKLFELQYKGVSLGQE